MSVKKWSVLWLKCSQKIGCVRLITRFVSLCKKTYFDWGFYV
ncbi:hypothetical protein [Moraxella lacunata]